MSSIADPCADLPSRGRASAGLSTCPCGLALLAGRRDAQRTAHALNRQSRRMRTRHRVVACRCALGGHHVTPKARGVRRERDARCRRR